MMKLFQKKKLPQPKEVVVAEIDDRPQKSTVNQIIEEIHETFFTEVDRLLEQAKVSHSLESTQQTIIDKCNRLKALGFVNTKEVKEAESEIKRIEELRADNERKRHLIEAIEYFSFRYPHYKFITEESVKKICAKYNLVYGEIDKYIGTVPDKNLKHIEDFKVSEEDACYEQHNRNAYLLVWGGSPSKPDYIHYSTHKLRSSDFHIAMADYYTCKSKLEIAAPLKDFDMKDYEVKDFKLAKKPIEIPDPVVLYPVWFAGNKHYLIVTAWGLEASDDLVMNPVHN